jgi:hypothetical protein
MVSSSKNVSGIPMMTGALSGTMLPTCTRHKVQEWTKLGGRRMQSLTLSTVSDMVLVSTTRCTAEGRESDVHLNLVKNATDTN